MPISEFTYSFSNYHNHTEADKACILQHDIDNDISFALKLATVEAQYPDELNSESLSAYIQEEAFLLSRIIDAPVTTVSIHRPSKWVLTADLKIPGIINSRRQTFFQEFKYLSESRLHWREPVEKIISEGQHKRIHLLIHPFWYRDVEMSCREKWKLCIRVCFKTIKVTKQEHRLRG